MSEIPVCPICHASGPRGEKWTFCLCAPGDKPPMEDLSIKQQLAERGITVGTVSINGGRELFKDGKSLGVWRAVDAVTGIIQRDRIPPETQP